MVNIAWAGVIDVPFSTQAPEGSWSQPWYDACEETSIVMVDSYYNQQSLSSDSAADKILQVFENKNNTLGVSYDENADKIIYLINKFHNWQAEKIINPKLSQIKAQLDSGKPVIIPVAGDLLNNEHFRGSVPYHVLVIKGYDEKKQEFITNDPGTVYGQSYRYSYFTIMRALHDFVARDSVKMLNGAPVAIFTKIDSTNLIDKTLIKSSNNPMVYYYNNNEKRHIINEQVFKLNNWQWSQIKIVSEQMLAQISSGPSIISKIIDYNLPNLSLIKSLESPKVYLLENNLKRYIVSPEVFEKNNWQWSQIQIVSQDYINNLNNGLEIK